MGKFTEYKIPLKSLPEGTHDMNFHIGKPFFVNMENNDIHEANLEAQLRIVYKNGLYDLTFSINGEVVVLCDRCLDDLHFPIETGYHIVVRYGDKYNDESDEFLEIPEGDNYLNVAYMLYDTIALAIPIKHVHPLGKCNRQMSALLKKHRAETSIDDTDETDEINDIDFETSESSDIETNEEPIKSSLDPRWEKLEQLKKTATKN